MFAPALLTMSTVVIPLVLSSPTRDCQFGRVGDPAADERALARFEVTVNDYVDLHRRLARAWPPMWFADFEQMESVAAEFRAVLRQARPQAAESSFFTPEVAGLLRFRLARALREQNVNLEAMTLEFEEEAGELHWWTPVVNHAWPGGRSGTYWPVFDALPPLPLELEYRLAGRSLVLLDVNANMVLDSLELALPAVATAR